MGKNEAAYFKDDRSERNLYFNTHMSELHSSQSKLIKLTQQHPRCSMMGSSDSIKLITNMIKFAGAKRCIDVGVYTGYSSLSWALSIPKDGQVVACDISKEYPEIGKPVWKEAGVEHKISLRIGCAIETLEAMVAAGEENTYDFMFIDADKTNYDTYFELGLKLVRPQGIIAIDNAWWKGKVMSEEIGDLNTESIKNLNSKIKDDPRVDAVLIDSGDGVFVCSKI